MLVCHPAVWAQCVQPASEYMLQFSLCARSGAVINLYMASEGQPGCTACSGAEVHPPVLLLALCSSCLRMPLYCCKPLTEKQTAVPVQLQYLTNRCWQLKSGLLCCRENSPRALHAHSEVPKALTPPHLVLQLACLVHFQ